VLTASWSLGHGGLLILLANLSDKGAERPARFRSGRPIWGGDPMNVPAGLGAVFWSIGAV